MSQSAARQLFVTTALPYANGRFHIGHIMEYIQADIWVRFQRMQGHRVFFVCADDAHGAPIMIAAEKAGLSASQFVANIAAGRAQYLDGFLISFDNWYSTDGPENHALAGRIFLDLKQANLIESRTIEQFYDPEKLMFLPDRFIQGECPKCGAQAQYGDNCEVCGAVYQATELRRPFSALTGAAPVLKSSEHFFFKLSDPRCLEFLQGWTSSGAVPPDVLHKINEWIAPDADGKTRLEDWDISRDAPYFGIEIPGLPGKYFYVWLDAPVGYLAALKDLFERGAAQHLGESRSFAEFMSDPQVEQYHFIGKDIITFHTLFWPAMLHFSGRKVPNGIFVHGFLTVKGLKMSKSRGTGLDPLRYLELGMNPEWLRYYLAAKLNGRNEDVEFNPEDFQARVNADLVGKFVNIAARAAGFIHKRFDGRLGRVSPDGEVLLGQLRQALASVAVCYEQRDTARVLREVMALSDRVNEYVDLHKPWELARQAGQELRLHDVCSVCIEAFRLLTAMLKPVLPSLAQQVEVFLQVPALDFVQVREPLGAGHPIGVYQHLVQRVEAKLIDDLFD